MPFFVFVYAHEAFQKVVMLSIAKHLFCDMLLKKILRFAQDYSFLNKETGVIHRLKCISNIFFGYGNGVAIPLQIVSQQLHAFCFAVHQENIF